MLYDKKIESGFQKAKTITKRFATTFYLASLFLPQEKRLASYAVYAICRISDESVDGQSQTNQKNAYLEKVRQAIEKSYSQDTLQDHLLLAFRYVVNRYQIPKAYFEELLEGMEMDLSQNRYQDFNELYNYCYKVAGVVGLIMLKILGERNHSSQEAAVKLGIAMQLTNILRDIKEDLKRGRIYLPRDDLKKFNLSESDLVSVVLSPGLKALLEYEIKLAQKYYSEAKKGIRFISGIRERFVVIAMSQMYSAILKEIRKRPQDILSKRVKVKNFKKALIILRIILKGDYLCA